VHASHEQIVLLVAAAHELVRFRHVRQSHSTFEFSDGVNQIEIRPVIATASFYFRFDCECEQRAIQ
jgi:hypothetical protein